jgi:hypothetical protein
MQIQTYVSANNLVPTVTNNFFLFTVYLVIGSDNQLCDAFRE